VSHYTQKKIVIHFEGQRMRRLLTPGNKRYNSMNTFIPEYALSTRTFYIEPNLMNIGMVRWIDTARQCTRV
jgi:hypothetical protein